MKRTLATLLAGIAIGAAVVAAPALSSSHSTKAGSLYWSKSSPRVYRCEGANSAVSCRSDAYRPRYSVLVSKGRVYACVTTLRGTALSSYPTSDIWPDGRLDSRGVSAQVARRLPRWGTVTVAAPKQTLDVRDETVSCSRRASAIALGVTPGDLRSHRSGPDLGACATPGDYSGVQRHHESELDQAPDRGGRRLDEAIAFG
jgi:hypothetical protein